MNQIKLLDSLLFNALTYFNEVSTISNSFTNDAEYIRKWIDMNQIKLLDSLLFNALTYFNEVSTISNSFTNDAEYISPVSNSFWMPLFVSIVSHIEYLAKYSADDLLSIQPIYHINKYWSENLHNQKLKEPKEKSKSFNYCKFRKSTSAEIRSTVK